MASPAQKRIVWTLAILCLMAMLGALLLQPAKPRLYGGRTTLEWVMMLDPDTKFQVQREAASDQLRLIGAPAVPELDRILRYRPNSWYERLRGRLPRLGAAPFVPRFELLSRACEAAYHLAERADVDISPLVPHLAYHATNGTYADTSGYRALVRAGPRGIGILTNWLFTGSDAVRDQAGWALGLEARRPEVAAALIRSATTETNRAICANALLYLQRSRTPLEQILPVALPALQSTDRYTRDMATTLLREYANDERVRKALEAASANSRATNAR